MFIRVFICMVRSSVRREPTDTTSFLVWVFSILISEKTSNVVEKKGLKDITVDITNLQKSGIHLDQISGISRGISLELVELVWH